MWKHVLTILLRVFLEVGLTVLAIGIGFLVFSMSRPNELLGVACVATESYLIARFAGFVLFIDRR